MYEITKDKNLKRKDLVHADLCYKVMGVLFNVWTNIGDGHREHIYQKAVSSGLKQVGLHFIEQAPVNLLYAGDKIGNYYFDFSIEDALVLEIKAKEFFSKNDIQQVYGYLKAKKLQLGLLAHFTKSGVKFKRIVNLT